jgi:hypothetical protein
MNWLGLALLVSLISVPVANVALGETTINISGTDSITAAYAQVEEQETTMTKVLSCELNPDSGLLCSNSELGLCILRTNLTDVGGGLTWNIMNPMLCAAE